MLSINIAFITLEIIIHALENIIYYETFDQIIPLKDDCFVTNRNIDFYPCFDTMVKDSFYLRWINYERIIKDF